jgi:L-lactate dehydrogenase
VTWVNRSSEKIEAEIIDLQQGLAFSPSCRRVIGRPQDARGIKALRHTDVVVIAAGKGVPPGGTRQDVLTSNAALVDGIVRLLLADYEGVVVVVTNPVDMMARTAALARRVPFEQTLGLGTIVETARLRASLASRVSPARAAREVWAYAVGTHDDLFVPVPIDHLGLGAVIQEDELTSMLESARVEVIAAAKRVKETGRDGTLFPIVEGIVSVLGAIAHDTQAILTASVHDPETVDHLFYSVPCRIGRTGAIERIVPEHPGVHDGLERCRDQLRREIAMLGVSVEQR